jgi:hypothetical protein
LCAARERDVAEGLTTRTHSLRKNVSLYGMATPSRQRWKTWSEYMMKRGVHKQQLPDVAIAGAITESCGSGAGMKEAAYPSA